jgi:hypothetical protein
VGSFGGSSYLTHIRISPSCRFRLKRAFISTPSDKEPSPTFGGAFRTVAVTSGDYARREPGREGREAKRRFAGMTDAAWPPTKSDPASRETRYKREGLPRPNI